MKSFRKTVGSSIGTALVLIFASVPITGCESAEALPSEAADVVVMKFYEYISEAGLRGGTIPLREAYKLTNSKGSRLSQAKFIEIARKYPPGFRVAIMKTEINGTQALVTIAYKMQSMFDEYTVKTVIPLSVDKSANTWKIDFTGESDGQEKYVTNKGA